MIFILWISFLSVLVLVSSSKESKIYVKYDQITQSFDFSSIESSDAYAIYISNYNNSGWNYLDIYMTPNITSVDQHLIGSKAMGYVEGYITCNDIKTFWPNFYSGLFGTEAVGNNTIAFLKANFEWMKENALKYGKTDEYWYAAHTTIQQVEGLYEGYVAGCGNTKNYSNKKTSDENLYATLDQPTLEHFLIINAWGDLYQIANKLLEPGQHAKYRGNTHSMKSQKKKTENLNEDLNEDHDHIDNTKDMPLIERCSAIVKILPNYEDVVYGHATWDTYESLYPRIIKHYHFPLLHPSHDISLTSYDVYFSSSPALLSSVDDFYTISGYSQLGVMETSNSLFNVTLLKLIHPNSMLSWTRIIISNQVSKSGYNWAETFARYHSGSYPNQWMILDLPLFTTGQVPSKGFYTVFEEVPGLVHYDDQTDYLVTNTFWPSYNNPFYEDIFIASGYESFCAEDIDFCHDSAPRALLFDQYQGEVKDIEGGKWILSYNDWQQDSASKDDSCNAIACRGDLELKSYLNGAYGALDAKVTTVLTSRTQATATTVTRTMVDNLSLTNDWYQPIIYARLGPTVDQQTPFCWSKYDNEADYVHNGHPDCFDFQWAAFPPSKL